MNAGFIIIKEQGYSVTEFCNYFLYQSLMSNLLSTKVDKNFSVGIRTKLGPIGNAQVL